MNDKADEPKYKEGGEMKIVHLPHVRNQEEAQAQFRAYQRSQNIPGFEDADAESDPD